MANKDQSLNDYQRPSLDAPSKEKKVLLHSCCAPCSGEVIEAIHASNIDQTVFFYNPNIHPKEEYVIRKNENKDNYLGTPIFVFTNYLLSASADPYNMVWSLL